MEQLNVDTASISQIDNNLNNLPWALIEISLINHFSQKTFQITICSGEVQCPPVEDREAIIREHHESAYGGHKGCSKTFSRIRERFYWKNLKEQVEQFIKTCESCQRKKLVRVKPRAEMIITDTPEFGMEKVACDLIGPLPRTEKQNRFILTIQCVLTKYSVAIPLPNAESTTIASAFAENFICRFGCPRILLSDLGTSFMSNLMSDLAKIFKIKRVNSSCYHPQGNSSCERHHHTLIQYLRHFIEGDNWDTWIPYSMFSYNSSIHESTGLSPHELIFGTKAQIPSEFTNQKVQKTFHQHLNELAYKLTNTQALAADRLRAAKQKSKERYDLKANPQILAPGDTVYYLKEPRTKLEDEYLGPTTIVRLNDKNNAEILLPNGKTKPIHTDKLKLAYTKL